MLLALRIANFSVVEELEVTFGPGLTVLTGETGAGKSILVDALGLLLGGRADADVIRTGEDEATVEALLEGSSVLLERLGQRGLPRLGVEVSLRRIIQRGGRGKAYVNGALVTVGVLAELMRGVMDIAGQHEHVGLFDADRHRVLVDEFGQLAPLMEPFITAFEDLAALDAKAEALGGDERLAQERIEFLRFQGDELEKWSPQPGEDVKLEHERRRLMGAHKLQEVTRVAEGFLCTQDGSAVELVGRALGLCLDGLKIDAALSPVVSSLQNALADLEDAGRTLSRYSEGMESDPARLAEVDERLDALRTLCRKHRTDLPGLLTRQAEIASERTGLENRQVSLDLLLSERLAAQAKAQTQAAALTQGRKAAALKLATAVRTGLARLAMPRASFEVRVEPCNALKATGADAVEFLFSANPGEALKPLRKVASGGEASRLLLALKGALVAVDGCDTYVLDEVDAGVSGGVADVVGQMVRDVSRNRQVLCITHLPQVAAYADAHLRVEKRQSSGRTASRVTLLKPDDRTEELARMLSGVKVSPEAVGAAQALLRSANRVSSSAPAPRQRRSA